MHEIFYRDTLHATSRYVRFFNGKVAANNLKDLSPDAKNKLFQNLNIEKFVIPPSNAIIQYQSFDNSGNPKELMIYSRGDLFEGVKLNGSFQVIYTKDEIRITTTRTSGTQQVSLPITNEIVQATDTKLYRSGALKEIYNPRGLEHKSQFKLLSNALRKHINCYGKFKSFKKYQPSIGFFPNGDLNFCLTDLTSVSHETPHYQATFYALPSPKNEYNLLYINKLGYIQYENLGLDVESFVADGAFTIQGNWHEMRNVGISDSGLPGFGEFIHPTTLIYNSIPYNTVQSSKLYFHPNGSLFAGKLKEKSIFTYEGHPISFRSKHVCPFYAKSSRHLYVKSSTGFGVVDIFDDGDFVKLSEDGQLSEAVVDARIDFPLNGKIYHLEENDVIYLQWKEGKLTHLQSTPIECEKK